MKKLTPLFFLFILSTCSFSQSEETQTDAVTSKIVEHYNSKNYEAFFDLLSSGFQQQLPLETITAFLSGLHFQYGEIISTGAADISNPPFTSYKTTFEQGILSLQLVLNEQLKVNGLLFEPYVEKVISAPENNQISIEESKITESQANAIFERTEVFPNNTQLSIAIIANGKIKYQGMQRQLENTVNIDNHQDLFEIGSITKVFTSTILAGLVSEGKIALESTIDKHLDFPLKDSASISFEELSTHTSGLPSMPTNFNFEEIDHDNPFNNYLEANLIDYLSNELEITEDRRGNYDYSNIGAGLLGYVLIKIEKASYEQVLQRRILSKYHMSSTTTDKTTIKGKIVKGQSPDGHVVPNWDLRVLVGAGGILSSVEDLSKFALAQFETSNKELELSRKDASKSGKPLGWHLKESKSGDKWFFHNGGTGGYTSSMLLDIEKKNAVIILSNVSAGNPNMSNIDRLCEELMESLVELNSLQND